MKKSTTLLLAAALLLVACGRTFDVAKVKRGMTTAQLVEAVGAPDDKLQMPMGIQWWKYGDNGLVIVASDTVVNFTADMKAEAEKGKKAIEEGQAHLNAVLDSVNQGPSWKHYDLSAITPGMEGDTLFAKVGEAEASKQLAPGKWWLVYGDQLVETKDFKVHRILDRRAAEDSLERAQ